MGYIYENGKMLAVSRVNLPLWQHGENGYPPSDYAFFFVAGKSLPVHNYNSFSFTCISSWLLISLKHILSSWFVSSYTKINKYLMYVPLQHFTEIYHHQPYYCDRQLYRQSSLYVYLLIRMHFSCVSNLYMHSAYSYMYGTTAGKLCCI